MRFSNPIKGTNEKTVNNILNSGKLPEIDPNNQNELRTYDPNRKLQEGEPFEVTQKRIKDNFDKLNPDEQKRITDLLIKSLPKGGIFIPDNVEFELIDIKNNNPEV